MNNKRLGMEFEREVCESLRQKGYWVHFIAPDNRGAQPFDIVAVKEGVAFAIDCKTSAKPIFPIKRLEDNQILAFEKWMACGNTTPIIYVKYQGRTIMVPYTELKEKGSVNLEG